MFSDCCAFGCLPNSDGQPVCAVVLGLDCKVCQVLHPAVQLTDALVLCSYFSLQRARTTCVRVRCVVICHGSECPRLDPVSLQGQVV